MPKITKTQQKRLVKDIASKAKKLFISLNRGDPYGSVLTVQDMSAIEKLTKKWLKRIG